VGRGTGVKSVLIDAQVHAWSVPDDPQYPWDPAFDPKELSLHEFAEDVVAEMDEVGIDAAVLVGGSMYPAERPGNSYNIDSAKRFPGRFTVVARPDWRTPEPKAWIDDLCSEPVVVAIRLGSYKVEPWAADGDYESMLAAAEEGGMPVCVGLGGANLPLLHDVAHRHPDLRIILDHFSLEAPPYTISEPGPDPFRHLPNVLALAEEPNVCVKMTGIPALSNEAYPFRDIWEPCRKVVSEFGVERVCWGTDFNRTRPLHSYVAATDWLAEADVFDDATKKALYSESIRSIFRWPSGVPA
jgi:predicted TIM-barrel fold metal-dependent hydrolase